MLNTQQKHYITKHFVVGSAIANAAINGGIAYLLFGGQAEVPLWGNPSLGVDTLVTIVMLTLITALMVNWSVGVAIKQGVVPPIEQAQGLWKTWGQRLPNTSWPRAILLSVVALILVAPLVLGAFYALELHSFSTQVAIVFKTVFATVLGLFVTPIVGVLALINYADRR